MDYLVRFDKGKLHPIAHYVHEVDGITGALCSQVPKPAAGQQTQSGQWELVTAIPETIKLCLICQRRKQNLENPLPARVEKELEMLARLDPRAAAFQREKMMAQYR